MESWLFFALLSTFLFALVSTFDKYGVYDKSNISNQVFSMYVGFSNLVVGILMLIIFGFDSFLNIYSFVGLGVGFIQGVGLIILFWALQKNDVTRVMPVWSSYPIVVLLISLTFTSEELGYLQIACMMIIVAGSIFSTINLESYSVKINFKNLMILAFGMTIFAISQVINKQVVQNIPVTQAFGLRGIGVVFTLSFPFCTKANLKEFRSFIFNWRLSRYLFFAETVLATFAYLTILLALLTGPVSLISAVSGARPIFIFLIYYFLSISPVHIKEDFNKGAVLLKAISAIFVSIGVIALGIT